LSLKKYVAAQAYNKKLLSNILPVHVAEFFMSGDKNNDVSTGTAHAHYIFSGLIFISITGKELYQPFSCENFFAYIMEGICVTPKVCMVTVLKVPSHQIRLG
jgi:hypothetical protein